MKTLTLVLAILTLTPAAFFSQQSPDIPVPEGRLLFAPLIAHHIEPRVGLSRLVGEERLRLDIGNSIDVLRWEKVTGETAIAVGADFFTWTSLRQEKDFHFPVDAVDYLFGVNASLRNPLAKDWTGFLRLRLSHISAHLVDGSYSKETEAWRNGQAPRVYSREFVDLVAAVEWRDAMRLYGGMKYIYHIDPAWLGQWTFQAGAEAVWRKAGWPWLHLYVATDVRFLDIDGWNTAVNVQAGAKVGRWRGTGVQLFLAWFHGKSQHGEYFDQTWSYWGPGFNIDF